jgi:hypothetical protein
MLSHPFHDIEVEELEHLPTEPAARLVKILAQDGRRFTYLVRAELDEGAIEFIRRMIEGGVASDLVIEQSAGVFRAEESPTPLPRHG